MTLQTLLRAVYPPQCIVCTNPTEIENGLCGSCWPQVHFIKGTSCDLCSTPLIGDSSDQIAFCDDCLSLGRPWSKGRAALVYRDMGRRLVLGLKHGDRTDFVPAMSDWMCHAGRDLFEDDPILIPVPSHRFRLLRRTYNQAAELAKAIGARTGLELSLQPLVRTKHTRQLGVSGVEDRYSELENAICANPRDQTDFTGRSVLIVDDVMTSGATLSACANTCLAMGARNVQVLVLARAIKDA